MMLKSDAKHMSPKIEKLFEKWGIKLHAVDWDVPPNMKHYPKTDAGTPRCGGVLHVTHVPLLLRIGVAIRISFA